jgi:hypothetical protein
MKLIELEYKLLIPIHAIGYISKNGSNVLYFKYDGHSYNVSFQRTDTRDKAYNRVIEFLTCDRDNVCRIHTNDE